MTKVEYKAFISSTAKRLLEPYDVDEDLTLVMAKELVPDVVAKIETRKDELEVYRGCLVFSVNKSAQHKKSQPVCYAGIILDAKRGDVLHIGGTYGRQVSKERMHEIIDWILDRGYYFYNIVPGKYSPDDPHTQSNRKTESWR